MSTEVTFRRMDDYYILDQLNTAHMDSHEYSWHRVDITELSSQCIHPFLQGQLH